MRVIEKYSYEDKVLRTEKSDAEKLKAYFA